MRNALECRQRGVALERLGHGARAFVAQHVALEADLLPARVRANRFDNPPSLCGAFPAGIASKKQADAMDPVCEVQEGEIR